MECADEPAAILFRHEDDHEAFAWRNFGSVRRLRAGDDCIGVRGREIRTEKANTSHCIRAKRIFQNAAKQSREPLFDIRAAVAVISPHVGEVRVLRERHGDGMCIMMAETLGEIGANLFDRGGIRIGGLRVHLRRCSANPKRGNEQRHHGKRYYVRDTHDVLRAFVS